MISVIVPVYNEEKILETNTDKFRALAKRAEFIFVDGGSIDRTPEIAKHYGKLMKSPKGRAVQMNRGAGQARGDTLLFLHADSTIPPEALESIEHHIGKDNLIGGCLTLRINKGAFVYRLIERQGNRRAERTKIFYGDQGIFVKRSVFLEAGGFPDVPLMEDILFSKKLKALGKTAVLPDKITVSARRWEKKGLINTLILYNLLMILFRLKFPLKKIKFLYGDLR